MAKRATYKQHLHECEPRGFAVYSKCKKEKRIHRRLAEQEEVALQKITCRYSRKVSEVEIPLFNRPLFPCNTRKNTAAGMVGHLDKLSPLFGGRAF